MQTSIDPADRDGPEPPPERTSDLLPPRRRRGVPYATIALACAVVAAGAFFGGIELQKHRGGASASGGGRAAALAALAGPGATSGLGARSGAGTGTGAGAGAGRFGGGGFTAGQVTLVKGSTLYVTDATGNTVKIAVGAGARVTKTATTKASAIRPGDTIVATGEPGSDGTIAASTVSVGGTGLGGLGRGFGFGQRGGGQGFGQRGGTGQGAGTGGGFGG